MKKLFLFFSLVLLTSLALLASETDQSLAKSYYHFSLAQMYDAQEDFGKAVSEYKKALKLSPESRSLRLEYAKTLWRMGELDSAIEETQEAIENDPNQAESHYLLGRIYFSHRTLPDAKGKAQAAFEKALEIDPEHSETLPYLGQLLYSEGKFGEAAQIFHRLRVLSPAAIKVYFYEAQALSQSGDVQGAIEVLEEGLQVRRDIPEYLELLADLYEKEGRKDKAIEFYLQAKDSDPDPEKTHQLAQLLIEEDRAGEAVSVLEEIIPLYPQQVKLKLALGKALRAEKRLEDAARVFEEITEEEELHLEANYELARTLAALGDRERAIEKFEQLLDITEGEPLRSLFKTHLAALYQESQQLDESIQLLRDVVERNPDDLDARLRLVYALNESSRSAEALALTSKVLDEFPDDVFAIIARGQSLSKAGQLDRAVEFLEGRVKDSKDPELLYIAASQLYLGHSEFEEAREIVQKALSTYPDSERLRFQLGAIYERQEKYEAAENQFKAILKDKPEDANVLNYLGYMLADQGIRLEEALGYIQKAVELDPYNGAYLDSLGWAYFKLSDYEKAETNLKKAIQLNGADPVILEHLGDLYKKLGNNDKALHYYEQSISVAEEEEEYKRVERKLSDLKSSLVQD